MRVRTLVSVSSIVDASLGAVVAPLTHSSLIVSSSEVGRRGSTKEKRDVERSLRKRRCKTPGCMLADGTVESSLDGMIARRLKG